ncbi:Bifunctional inhibitor/lipid-transfer protein/seed storage 2S albumin superfamily protein [Striga hermonthica]|uniref:Bifunctional inhibitor/lipid-transfer protein/seed storage 2S albumin superfamily protein n=1 Tax=Striga hermonthica TaxID=68872 RepID=A0A9N7P1Z3_STRHE|nr:Bifunctional inhibitor/lipid-transfer protein/seed storage 2S albumin superfamily protein [Striga hermonthica]
MIKTKGADVAICLATVVLVVAALAHEAAAKAVTCDGRTQLFPCIHPKPQVPMPPSVMCCQALKLHQICLCQYARDTYLKILIPDLDEDIKACTIPNRICPL